MKQLFYVGDLIQLKSYDEVLQYANTFWPAEDKDNKIYVNNIFSELDNKKYTVEKIYISNAGIIPSYELRLEDIITDSRLFQDYFVLAEEKENDNIVSIFG